MAFAEITQNGLSRKSLQEIQLELQDAWRLTFGADLDLSPGSPDGHHVDQEANMISSLVELAQGIYAAIDPTTAEDIWLDIINDYLGLERIGAAQSRVDLIITGAVGTVIPAGAIVRPPSSVANFLTVTSVTLGESGATVRAVASAVGPLPAPAGAWTLVNVISGVTGIRADSPGIIGRNQETNDEFRLRKQTFARGGRATEDAIKSYMLNTVPGVVSVSVTSNRDEVIDEDGRPPHCVEIVVEGGEDADVANGIWTSVAGGIRAFGNYPETGWPVIDSSGRTQKIKWTREQNLYGWFRVNIQAYEEEVLPEDYNDQIKAAIVSWAASQYSLGKDIIPGRVTVPVWTVPGISYVEVLAAVTYLESTTPGYNDYTGQRIAIDARHIVRVDSSRIMVELTDAN